MLPSLRSQSVLAMFVRLLAQRPRTDFQVVHYSVQSDHVHLIVEAKDAGVLARAMNSLEARFAKRFNKVIGRTKGKVWDHRYHRRDLESPTEVGRAMKYVFDNWKKHGHAPRGCVELDPFSSAVDFHSLVGVPFPRTWLLAFGWQKGNWLS